MRESGKRTSSTDTDSSFGQMRQYTKENIKVAKSTARDCFCGRTIAAMRVSSSKTTFMASASMCGRMDEYTRENGGTTKCREEESSHG